MARKTIAEIEARRAAENSAPSSEPVVFFPRGLALAIKDPVTKIVRNPASDYSGLTVCMLRSLVWNRTLPAQLHGKRIIILREDLDHYLIANRKNSAMEEHLRERADGVFRKRAHAARQRGKKRSAVTS